MVLMPTLVLLQQQPCVLVVGVKDDGSPCSRGHGCCVLGTSPYLQETVVSHRREKEETAVSSEGFPGEQRGDLRRKTIFLALSLPQGLGTPSFCNTQPNDVPAPLLQESDKHEHTRCCADQSGP